MSTIYNVGVLETYTTIQDAVNAIPADLAGTGLHEVVIEKGTYVGGANIYTRSNTSSDDRIIIRAKTGDEHKGVLGSGVYITGGKIHCYAANSLIKDIEIEINANCFYTHGHDITWENCIGIASSGIAYNSGVFDIRTGMIGTKYLKCIAINSNPIGTDGPDRGFSSAGTATRWTAYGCIAYGFRILGFRPTTQYVAVLYNCISYSNGTGGTSFGSCTVNTSASDDEGGSIGYQNLTLEELGFVDPENGNFHLNENSVLIHAGTDASSHYTTDIDGDAISGAYPIGVDHNFIFYVDLGINTVASSVTPSSSTGSIADPINAGDWVARAGDGGTGATDDRYIMKGSTHVQTPLNRFTDAKGWDIALNGPWRIKIDNIYDPGIPAPIAISNIRDSVIYVNQIFGSAIMFYVNLYNCMVLSNLAKINKGGAAVYKGVTFEPAIQEQSNNLFNNYYTHCLFRRAFVAGSGIYRTHKMTSNNCVFTEVSSDPSSFPDYSVVTDLGSQFNFVPEDTVPTDWLEADLAEFAPDSAISILSNGDFTDHVYDLFGNPRAVYEESASEGAIGSGYFAVSEYYVDLGTDEDGDSVSASGIGTTGDPLNTRAFVDRARSDGGIGLTSDLYYVRGYGKFTFGGTDEGIGRFSSLLPWNLLTYGPWQFNSLNTDPSWGKNNLGSITKGGLIASAGTISSWGKFYNVLFDGSMLVEDGGINDPELHGCTVKTPNIGPGLILLAKDSVFHTAWADTDIALAIVDAHNCVLGELIPEPDGNEEVFIDDNGSCQFAFVPADTLASYGDTDQNAFFIDSNVNINSSSGDFTDYTTGLFGGIRTSYESGTGDPAVGAQFFDIPPLPLVVFTTLEIGEIKAETIEILVTGDVDSTNYFVVLPKDDTAPTSAQVQAGTDGTGTTVDTGFSGNGSGTATVVTLLTASNLLPNTEYDIWVVATNAENALQASPTLLQNTTTVANSSITSFDGITMEAGSTDELTITGVNFTVGGVPTLTTNAVSIPINSYSDTEIKFYPPSDLDVGNHVLIVLNGAGL